MKVAVVGATGLVGSVMTRMLEERNFPVTELIPVASERSVGKEVTFRGDKVKVVSIEEGIRRTPRIALFSAGGSTSENFAPAFVENGACVIDNSSAWRMDPDIKLVVPEVNGHLLDGNEGIIANPNCSTIQLVVALAPVHEKFGIKRMVISTYQSLTGTGQKAVAQYKSEKALQTVRDDERAYPHPIFENCIPHCDVFLDNSYTREEMKLVHETHKIIGDESIRITATAVRVPVLGGHSESVNVELINEFDLSDVISVINAADGVKVIDNVETNQYPMPLTSMDKDGVMVGRIRRDDSHDNAFNCWIVADNLRKGAATNAIEIAERMVLLWNK